MSKQLWVEKYRPSTMDEYVWRDPAMRAKAEEWIAEGSIPHCLFVGVQGTGKTSLCYLLLKALDIPSGDIMYINASRERKVEDIQDRIGNFINTWALGPTGLKYIILDECLSENEKIRLVDGSSLALKDFEDLKEYAVKSLNMETGLIEDDTAFVISRSEKEIFEVELEDGRKISASADHPFLIIDSNGNITERLLCDLREDDHILSVS